MKLTAKKSLTNFRENAPSQKFHWVLNTLRVLKCSQIDLVNQVSSQRKVEKHFVHPSENSEGPLGDVLGMSLKRQIRTSPRRSNRIFRGSPGDAGGGRPRDILRTNICRLGSSDFLKIKFNSVENLPLKKMLRLHNLTVAVRSFFQEGNKH